MIKKCVAILLMSFSAMLLVGHDIIPHHHEDNKDHRHHYHHTDHHSDHHSNDSHASHHHSDSNESPDENGDLGDLLSYFVHTGDITVQESAVKQIVDVENERSDNSVVEIGNHISFCPLVSKSIGYTYKGPGYIPPLPNSKGLRGPPVFFS